MNTPVVLSYFSQSNNRDDPYLKFLQDEYNGIAEAWEQFQATGSENYVNAHFPARGNSDSVTISKDIRTYRNRVVVFHFSGHAGSDRLIFRDGAAYADGLAALLGEAKNLKVVLLNGCATHDQVRLLLKKGVVAVIATRGKVLDGVAMKFGIAFHQALSSKSYTIEEAFKHAIQSLVVTGQAAPGNFFIDRTTSRGLETEWTGDGDQWRLYYNEEAARTRADSGKSNENFWELGVIRPSQKEILTEGSFWDRFMIAMCGVLFLLGISVLAYAVFFTSDKQTSVIGLASMFLSLFGYKNMRRYKTVEENVEIMNDDLMRKLKLT